MKLNYEYVNKNYDKMSNNSTIGENIYLYHSNSWKQQIFNEFYKKFANNQNKNFLIIE